MLGLVLRVGDSGVQSPHESKHVSGYKRRTGGGGHLPSVARTASARRAMAQKARGHARARAAPRSTVTRMAAQMKPMPEARGPKVKV